MGREVAAQLARRDRILEDLELLDVGVAVAAALEQEVALAERPGTPEQRLGPERDGVAQGRVECRSDGGHSSKSTAYGRYSTPFDDGRSGLAWEGRADELSIGRHAATTAFRRQLVDQAHGERRIGEDRGADLDGDRPDREEVEDVVESRHATDGDDRDADRLGRLVDDAQGDRLDRRPD